MKLLIMHNVYARMMTDNHAGPAYSMYRNGLYRTESYRKLQNDNRWATENTLKCLKVSGRIQVTDKLGRKDFVDEVILRWKWKKRKEE